MSDEGILAGLATPMSFDARDKPRMGDPFFVDAEVRARGAEANEVYQHYIKSANPGAHLTAQDEITALAERWAKVFCADNAEYVQTLSLEGQAAWLRDHGYGSDDVDNHDPVRALVAAAVKPIIDAARGLDGGHIDEEACQFRIDVAIEDCTAMLLGIENSAD